MLVLVSFGLVLLATILLIVGLFNDTLGLIYLSIVASVVAAIVLFLAFRLARPKSDKGRDAPEPMEDDSADDTSVLAAVDTAADEDADVDVVETADGAAPAAPADSSDDDWMDDDEWDDDVVDFPIADYDDLTVAEVMPLLPQLYSDELDLVIDRERKGRNRSSIIRRLEELKVSGTQADAEDADVPETGGAAATSPSVFSDGADDLFPIADYDDLTVGQIMPLLGQLEDDELADVRDRERSGAGRKTLLAEIERRLSGDEPAPAPAPAPARKAAAKKSAPRPAKKATSRAKAAPAKKRATKKKASKKKASARKAASRPRFPIADYDDLTVADIRPRLTDLSDAQLRQVREREAAGAARKTILNEIDSRLS